MKMEIEKLKEIGMQIYYLKAIGWNLGFEKLKEIGMQIYYLKDFLILKNWMKGLC